MASLFSFIPLVMPWNSEQGILWLERACRRCDIIEFLPHNEQGWNNVDLVSALFDDLPIPL
jgi:hypothetical protein